MATSAVESSDELAFVDGLGQAELVRTGEVTSTELVEAAIDRIQKVNPRLNAVVTECSTAPSRPRADRFPRVRSRASYVLKDLAVEYAGVRFTEGSRSSATTSPRTITSWCGGSSAPA